MPIDNNLSYDSFKYIVTSKMRLNLIISLLKSSKNLEELREELDKTSINILKGLKELKEIGLIDKQEKIYYLTPTGQLVALNIINLHENWCLSQDKNDFWSNHYIDSIPSKFFKEIKCWRKSKLIKSDNVDFGKAYNTYLNHISKSKNINIVLPIFSRSYLNAIFNTIKTNDGKLEIISNKSILKYVNVEFEEIIDELVEKNRIKIYLTEEDMEIFLTNTDEFSALYLFLEDNCFDDSEFLINTDEKMNLCINSLFKHLKGYSTLVNL